MRQEFQMLNSGLSRTLISKRGEAKEVNAIIHCLECSQAAERGACTQTELSSLPGLRKQSSEFRMAMVERIYNLQEGRRESYRATSGNLQRILLKTSAKN